MKNESYDNKKFGRVVLVGRPNTGKSTLLNAIMDQKVAITSHLPQTTRKNARVVFAHEKGKIIFSDTPGIFNKVEDLVSKKVNTEAPKELNRADVLVCVVDISRPRSEEENKVIGLVRKSPAKKILVYNKIDIAKGSKDHLSDYNYLEDEFESVVYLSAIKGTHVKDLINKIFDLLPETDEKTIEKDAEILEAKGKPVIGMTSKEFVAELIREKAYLFLRDEIPYTVDVNVREITDKGKIIIVKADILTTVERYKKMIIGLNGRRIKEIGFNARKELELMSQKKVFLELEVKLDKHWPERVLV